MCFNFLITESERRKGRRVRKKTEGWRQQEKRKEKKIEGCKENAYNSSGSRNDE